MEYKWMVQRYSSVLNRQDFYHLFREIDETLDLNPAPLTCCFEQTQWGYSSVPDLLDWTNWTHSAAAGGGWGVRVWPGCGFWVWAWVGAGAVWEEGEGLASWWSSVWCRYFSWRCGKYPELWNKQKTHCTCVPLSVIYNILNLYKTTTHLLYLSL